MLISLFPVTTGKEIQRAGSKSLLCGCPGFWTSTGKNKNFTILLGGPSNPEFYRVNIKYYGNFILLTLGSIMSSLAQETHSDVYVGTNRTCRCPRKSPWKPPGLLGAANQRVQASPWHGKGSQLRVLIRWTEECRQDSSSVYGTVLG